MANVSFIIVTGGDSDSRINQTIDSIELLNIPNYEVIIVGSQTSTVKRKNTLHVPFDESMSPMPWYTKKKNLGVKVSKYEISVVMHDYYVFDANWYEELIKFGTEWDICVHQHFVLPENGGYRFNGWRTGPIPNYPEIPYNLALPWDIDCFIPYMVIHGSYWVVKKETMIRYPLDESLFATQADDIEWSSRVVPGWLGQKTDQIGVRIVANPNCISRLSKDKGVWPCGPDNEEISESLNWVWKEIREGIIRPGTYYYDSCNHKIKLS
jgi:hypothetical protein